MKLKGTLFIFSFLIAFNLQGQNTVHFENLSTLDGLVHSHLFSIATDINGLIWIGSWDGLSSYDGYRFENYSTAKTNPGLAGSNVINVIEPDSLGYIWFGTEGAGMSVFHPNADTFINYQLQVAEGRTLPGNNVASICHFKDKVWIGTEKGLSILDRQTDSILNFSLTGSGLSGQVISIVRVGHSKALIATPEAYVEVRLNEKQLAFSSVHLNAPPGVGNPIQQLYLSPSGQLWIVHEKSIQCTDYQSGQEIKTLFQLDADEINASRGLDLHFQSVFEQSDQEYLIATDQSLLKFRNKPERNYQLSQHESLNTESLSGNIITGICMDREENVWISTRFNGISKIDPRKQAFKRFSRQVGNRSTMNNNEVRALLQDRQGDIWIGYRNQGLDLYQAKTGNYLHFYDTASSLSNFIRAAFEDVNGEIWVGTFDGIKIMTRTKDGYKYRDIKSICGVDLGTVYDFHADSEDRIWIASNNGLFAYAKENGTSKVYKHSDETAAQIREYSIRDICEDPDGRLWLATDGGGIDVFHPDSGFTQKYVAQPGKMNSLSHNKVYCVFYDSKNRLWAGTQKGLNLLAGEGGIFKVYTHQEGLINDVVYSIQEDDDHYLWISTANGLSRMQPENGTFQNYMEGFEFSDDAWAKNDQGEFLLGGLKGFIRFHPKDVLTNHIAPLVRISSFKLKNKILDVNEVRNGRAILPCPIKTMEQLDLKHDENFFSFDLLGLSLSDPHNIKYQYKLSGFNDQWINTDAAIRTAVFTNVPHGKYEFKYRAANADGIWSNEQVLSVVIHPALYQTVGFKVAIAVFAMLLFITAYWLRLRNLMLQKKKLKEEVDEKTSTLRTQNLAIENQNRQLEKQKEEIEEQIDKVIEMTRQIHESDERKIRFFTSVSHEIRTPLTLISSPIEKLLDSLSQDDPHYSTIKLVERNTHRLLTLVNQLLDFRKIDTGHMSIKPVHSDLAMFAKNLFENFKPWAEKKNIDYIFQSNQGDYKTPFDQDILEKVISNLLSNAIKYTQRGGKVSMSLNRSNGRIYVTVKDNGPGISDKSRKSIFKRFYRIDQEELQKIKGSGIGLALAKEMSILHGGDLSLLRTNEKGSSFQFFIPTDQINDRPDTNEYQFEPLPVPLVTPMEKYEDFTVLIVEDNHDLRTFIKDSIDGHHILEAINGEEGINLAIEKIPDIIISDVLMPCKNGFELCRTLKADPRTNHIPIIMLTALGADENQQMGIDLGADDYIVKPFNHRILAGKINNIILARQSFKERIQKNLSAPEANQENWKDPFPAFVIQIIEQIEKNLDQEKFGVEELCETMCMSSSTLYRKMKLITNKSTVEFIREVRIRKALEYLQKDPLLQISEVAFMIGFEDVNYFRKCFKKQFGKSPTEFLQKNTTSRSV